MLKRKKKYGLTSGDVGKIPCFLHMALQIAVMHLSLSEKDYLKVVSSHLNDDGNYVILKVEIQSSPFILINYFAPNEEGQQVQILTELSDILEKMELEEDTQLI